jgi:methanogenic corrinoid protein MtbC1
VNAAADLTVDANAEAVALRVLRQAIDGRGSEAYQEVDALLVAGWSIERIITAVLASVQRHIGEQWQAGYLTIADEHAATAVVDDLLGALGRQVAPTGSHGTVSLVCAEGEWHVTPARMAALLLRQHGWRTTFLGGSTPANHLALSLEVEPPTFLAVSCTDPRFLLGAAAVADVGRELDIPTLAGGQAFGTTGKRAERLGFDGWAPSIPDAARLLEQWMDVPPPPRAPRRPLGPSQGSLVSRWSSISDQAIQRLTAISPPVLHHLEQPLEAVREDLMDLLRTARLAEVCDDPSVFTEFVAWRRTVPSARGIPPAAVGPSIAVLVELTRSLGDRTHEILCSSVG